MITDSQKIKEITNRDFPREVTDRFLFAVDRIMGHRSGEKVTQTKISEVVGMNTSNISRLRTDLDKKVTIEACCRLCSYYHVSTYWLFLGGGQIFSNDELLAAHNILEARVTELEKAFSDLEMSFEILNKSVKGGANKPLTKRK